MGLSFEFLKPRPSINGQRQPRNFDRNLVVIGGGSAGLVTAYIAAAVNAKVSLVEKSRMGGDCLYTGCVPSKTLIRTAKFLHDVKRSQALGVATARAEFNFEEVMDRVERVIRRIEPHDSPERYESLGVECLAGEASIENPWSVRVGEHALSTRSIVIATGGKPFVPPIDGLQPEHFVTSDSIWKLRTQPQRLVVLGGGPIGCEMAQAFSRLGSEVTLVEMESRILGMEDPDVSAFVAQTLEQEGVAVRTGHRAVRVQDDGGGRKLICAVGDGETELGFSLLLVAVGRRANVRNLGLEELGVEVEEKGTIKVNEFLQTSVPNIYACGDVIAPYQFTHSAAHEAWYCAVNALFGDFYKTRVDYSALPWTTFVDPEVAHLGLNEQSARDKGVDVEVTRYDLSDLDRALAEEEGHGFVKVLTPPGKDDLLGVTVVGPHAGDLMAEFVLAKRAGLGLGKILGTVHSYPTLAEAAKMTAGAWRRANKPDRLLRMVERFHKWRR